MIYFACCVTPVVRENHSLILLGMLMQLQTALSVYLSICGTGTMRLSKVMLSYRELKESKGRQGPNLVVCFTKAFILRRRLSRES